uniref:EOG090X0BNZ n=1 Tax=Eubosmina coregoni TaxID=186181 RepID=A0A4Y7LLH5_9CRUS|nr:EOG090X0BNZ [Eubosmina coregoni]
MLNLHVSLRIPATCRRAFFQFENVSPDVSVADFKKEILSKAGLDQNQTQLELVYSCCSLSDKSTLKALEGQNNVVKIIYANIMKPVVKQEVKKLDGAEQQQLFYAFRSAMNNPNFRQILQNASKPENVKLLIEKVPGLAEDHVALSMLQDWELMLHLADPKIVQALVEKHPSMALAAKEIISTVPGMLQQQSGSSSSARRAQAGWLARSLGADDDESMDQAPPAQQNAGLSITPAQLAAALNFAQNNLRSPQASTSQQPSSVLPPQQRQSPRPTTSAPAPTGLTPELFTQALLSAMASSRMGPVTAATAPSTTTTSSSSGVGGNSSNNLREQEDEQLREQFDRYLPQMRELGITDDSLSLRALQATNGDVQAAVNLIFAGLVDD